MGNHIRLPSYWFSLTIGPFFLIGWIKQIELYPKIPPYHLVISTSGPVSLVLKSSIPVFNFPFFVYQVLFFFTGLS